MKKARISFIILVLMSIVLCTALPGLAEKEAKVYDWLQMGQISDAVYDVQAALTKLKYFPEGVKVNFSVYDEATEKAVQLFCEENNIEREPGKISPDLQRFLLESSLSARVTPDTGKEPQGYDWLFYGRSSDAVTEVQKKLADLNYFDEDASYKMGVFDKATADAMRLFCKVNHIEFPSEGISPDIQKFMLEGSPKPRPTPTPSPVPTPTEVPTPTPFPNYTIGAYDGEVIAGVQKRLKILKYFEGLEGSMMFGEYDDVTEEAVKRFCEVQGIMYMPEKGLTKELYGFIMASDAPEMITPSPTPFLIGYSASNDEMRDIQEKLNNLGYFRDFGEPEWGTFDSKTYDAALKFCEVNGFVLNPNGIDGVFRDRLNSPDVKENPIPFELIRKGADDEKVKELQDRLFTLGYYKNKDSKRTGVCDDDMIAAVALFAQRNSVVFDNVTITEDLFNQIMSENALKYSDTVENKPFFERVKDFLTGGVSFMGIRMPMFLVILLVVIILAGLTFLLIHTFGSDGKNGDSRPAADSLKDSWNISGGSGEGARRAELEVRFRGSSQRVVVNLDKPLRIGRTEHTLPLNESDSDISRHHCQMYFRGDALLLRDYSTNGTSVNHKPYHNCECVIHSGDILSIGNHEISVRIL